MRRIDGTKYRFFYNSDFDGDVIVMDIKNGHEVCKIPFDDFKRVVATAVYSKRISDIEQMDDDKLLGL